MNVLILGANGFIGSHLCERILKETNWQIGALDLHKNNLEAMMATKRLHFKQGDMTNELAWLREQIQQCDVVLPLVAIAMPALYVKDPLRIFELDFEANLKVIRLCVEYRKRIIFPSTSEVYGMCEDEQFDEENSHLITGPIHKERWIYSSSKQLLDRIIYAYGKHHDLSYTLFRPFNWYGPRLDNIDNTKKGTSRVLTQFLGNIIRGENIQLVDGGEQKRCFTYIDDGIDALLKILEKKEAAHQQIFNIGNPEANLSIAEMANQLLSKVKSSYPQCTLAQQVKIVASKATSYYGEGYQDIKARVPAIHRACASLQWQPKINFEQGLEKTLNYYFL